MYNLIDEKWIPVKRSSGVVSMIAPWELIDEDQPIEICHKRPDFNSYIMQFLIGLVQAVWTPDNDEEWLDILESGIDKDVLKSKMHDLRYAFELYSDDKPFMQDSTIPKENPKDVLGLLKTTPGENTVQKSTDFIVKHKIGSGMLCSSCAAIALNGVQSTTNMGGRGLKKSIRGNSAMTVLVTGKDLFQSVWLNVLSRDRIKKVGGDDFDAIPFPWIKGAGANEVPSDNNPCMVYWTLPRSIVLDRPRPGKCDVCGSETNCVDTYYEKSSSTQYSSWIHPLCPYKKGKNDPFPMEITSDMAYFQQWYSALFSTDLSNRSMNVDMVCKNMEDLQDMGLMTGLNICGYECDNASVKSWVNINLPWFMKIPDDEPTIIQNISKMIGLVDYGLIEVCGAVRRLFGSTKKDTQLCNVIKNKFLSSCDSEFIHRIISYDSSNPSLMIKGWPEFIRSSLLNLYDEYTDTIPLERYDTVITVGNNLNNLLSKKVKKWNKEMNG